MKRIVIIILTLAVLTPYHAFALTYKLTPLNTTIQFKVKNFVIMFVKGSFERFTGTVDIDEADITRSKADVSIDVSSINTGINKRDNDLRSANFFDVEKFPVMKFVSTKIEKDGANKLKLTGNLTIKGVTKPVVLTVEGPSGEAAGARSDFAREASATTIINRKDFGVSSGSVIGDEVFIAINSHLKKE